MPKTKISEYSTANSDNTDIESININEGCAPSGINNAIRELMVHLKEFQTGASSDPLTVAGTFVASGGATIAASAGTSASPSIHFSGDTNTGIFSPAADTIAFAEGGVESMRINSSGQLLIGLDSALNVAGASWTEQVAGTGATGYVAARFSNNSNPARFLVVKSRGTTIGTNTVVQNNDELGSLDFAAADGTNYTSCARISSFIDGTPGSGDLPTRITFSTAADGATTPTERMRIDSIGNVGIGTSAPVSGSRLAVVGGSIQLSGGTTSQEGIRIQRASGYASITGINNDNNAFNPIAFFTGGTEAARIDTSGNVFFTKTASDLTSAGMEYATSGRMILTTATNLEPLILNRQSSDGTLIEFRQANAVEGSISVSGTTVSYNAFSGAHWSQLQQGRGYNPEIPRGTVMSTIGEMAEWKSVVWDEVIEHPAVPAVEAKEAVLDEEGNVIEPAVEAVEGKDAWTETINNRDSYLGQLPIGATFEEDGFTKTVVDDGNERLPKVKISDVIGDKAVYGVFQTWDEVEDMLVTSLGAFVVRIAAGVTVQIGDLLESNGDGCAKVQDDDVIRSKTIAKVTSITPTATYADGSYTVPAVIYCG